MRNLSKLLTAVFIFSYAHVAQAVLVTETWRSTVTYVEGHTAFEIDDTFEWTVTYDDSAQIMHAYEDGTNGIAEGGSGDDTLLTTYCTTAVPSTYYSSCTQFHSGFAIFADAVYDVSAFYDTMSDAGYTGDDYYNTNAARYWESDNGVVSTGLVTDDLFFNTHAARTFYAADPNGSTFTQLESRLISSMPVASVPEPSTVVLLGLGIAGLGFARRRRKQA